MFLFCCCYFITSMCNSSLSCTTNYSADECNKGSLLSGDGQRIIAFRRLRWRHLSTFVVESVRPLISLRRRGYRTSAVRRLHYGTSLLSPSTLAPISAVVDWSTSNQGVLGSKSPTSCRSFARTISLTHKCVPNWRAMCYCELRASNWQTKVTCSRGS